MPYHTQKGGGTCAADEVAVLKDSDGATMGCHPDQAAADDQMAALYANDPGAKEQGRFSRFRHFWNNLFDALLDDDAPFSVSVPVFDPALVEKAVSQDVKPLFGNRLGASSSSPDYTPVSPLDLARVHNPDLWPDEQRALSMSRLADQLWNALNPMPEGGDGDPMELLMSSGDWAWPMDLYVDDGQFYCIYTQGGSLYRVDLSVRGEQLMLGNPIQVTEAFPAVASQEKSSFSIFRQADGHYRWVMIAGTTVLNRVGEIDSSELFDSFIQEAEQTGEYPALDYYHLGGEDGDAFEFGRADLLMRDGVCYIASGLFNEEHPLAQGIIRTSNDGSVKWGASIEFRAYVEPELVTVQGLDGSNPVELRIPVYQRGKNTRISVLREVDAAGLFTTFGVMKEISRMRADLIEKLALALGNTEEARQFADDFGLEVDRANQTVQDKGLVHREQPGEEEEEQEQEEAAGPADLVLDEEAMAQIVDLVLQQDIFASMHSAINSLDESLTAQATILEARDKEIADLKKRLGAVGQRLQALEREEEEKQQGWLEDLPANARRQVNVTVRPRHLHAQLSEEGEEGESMADSAARTLASLPKWGPE